MFWHPLRLNNKPSFQPITKQPFLQKVRTLRQYLPPVLRSNWLSLNPHNVIPKRWVRYDSTNATAKFGDLFHGRYQIFVEFLIALERFQSRSTQAELRRAFKRMDRFTVSWVLFVLCVCSASGKPTKHKSSHSKTMVKRWDLIVEHDRKFECLCQCLL